MKGYISAILIPCLLMQFVGCYSFRSMTLEELKNYEGQNDIKIQTNQKETLINRKSGEDGSINWYSNDSSIVVETRESISLEDYAKLSSQDIEQLNHTLEIKYNEIIGIEIDEVNLTATVLLTVVILGVVVISFSAYNGLRL
jgi:hypothetical protein